MQADHNKKSMEDQDNSQVPTDRHFDNFNEDNKEAAQQEEKASGNNEGQHANEANESTADNS